MSPRPITTLREFLLDTPLVEDADFFYLELSVRVALHAAKDLLHDLATQYGLKLSVYRAATAGGDRFYVLRNPDPDGELTFGVSDLALAAALSHQQRRVNPRLAALVKSAPDADLPSLVRVAAQLVNHHPFTELVRAAAKALHDGDPAEFTRKDRQVRDHLAALGLAIDPAAPENPNQDELF